MSVPEVYSLTAVARPGMELLFMVVDHASSRNEICPILTYVMTTALCPPTGDAMGRLCREYKERREDRAAITVNFTQSQEVDGAPLQSGTSHVI